MWVNRVSIASDNGLSAPNHYLKQCWAIVNCNLRNKLQWNFNPNTKQFHSRKCLWKYGLRNGAHFIQGRWIDTLIFVFAVVRFQSVYSYDSSTLQMKLLFLCRELQTMMTSSNGNIFRVTGPLLRGIHRSPVNSPHKGQWRGALMFSLISAWINCWVNNRGAGILRRHRAHYDVIVMH